MKTEAMPRTVLTTGVQESHEFTMKVNGTSMLTMASLYSDRPWAKVREYGTNMFDGHVRLKKERPDAEFIPPEIHLPNGSSPLIMFKDYGIGMDYHTLTRVFTGFFDTLKGENNDEVGGLGLGAKVGFSYTDNFIVESRYDGVLYICSAYIKENGMPTLDLVSTTETDEPNGVTVKIPVKVSDIHMYRDPVTKLVNYFPIPIRVFDDGDEWEHTPLAYDYKGKAWGIRTADRDIQVVMGNVPYPLDLRQVEQMSDGMKFLRGLQYKAGVDLVIPVGQADVVPSREALRYTPRTTRAVVKAADEMLLGLRLTAKKAVWSAPNYWEATLALHAASKVHGLADFLTDITWKGREVSHKGIYLSMVELAKKAPGIKLANVSPTDSLTSLKYRENYYKVGGELLPLTEYEKEKNLPQRVSVDVDATVSLPTGGANTIVFDDLPADAPRWTLQRRVKHLMAAQATRRYKRGDYRTVYPNNVAYIFTVSDPAHVKIVQEQLSGYPSIFASELEDPPRDTSRSYASKKAAGIKEFDFANARMEESDVTTESGGLYVRMRGGEIDGPGTYNIKALIRVLRKLGYMAPEQTVYGIPRTRESVERKKGWRLFTDFAKEYLLKYAAPVAQRAADQRAWTDKHEWRDVITFLNEPGILDRLREAKPRSPLIALYNEWSRVFTPVGDEDEGTVSVDQLTQALEVLAVKVPVKTARTKPETLLAKCKQKHRHFMYLMDQISTHRAKQDADILLDFITEGK
jgi:hypothetical protein